jgi:hypothetical protein
MNAVREQRIDKDDRKCSHRISIAAPRNQLLAITSRTAIELQQPQNPKH